MTRKRKVETDENKIQKIPRPFGYSRISLADLKILEDGGIEMGWLHPTYANPPKDIIPESDHGKLFFDMVKGWVDVTMLVEFQLRHDSYFSDTTLKNKETYIRELSKFKNKTRPHTAPDLPYIVHTLRNPPPQFPLTRAIPKGTFMVSLLVMFQNFVIHVRIEKNENA